MFVAFEGIDGSGKTTLSNLVAQRLRACGLEVVHARESGVLATGVARRVREVTRDPALLDMTARSELFLNLAREVQQLDQVVRPALARNRICLADRSLHSLVALAVAGRGLPRAEVLDAVRIAAQGTWPHVAVLVDVEPEIARLRKQAAKIQEGRARESSSRKGLAGAGLQARIRAHLLAEASGAPDRWVVVPNRGRLLADVADEVAEELRERLAGGRRRAASARPPPANVARAAAGAAPEEVAALFHAAVAELAPCDPALAARLVASIPGRREHEVRAALAARVPRLVARALTGLGDAASARLRRELAGAAPADVAASLEGDGGREAMRLRGALLDRAPTEVAASLSGLTSAGAWALRDRALERGALEGVLEGLEGVDELRSWALRSEGMLRGLWAAVGRSLGGVASPRADPLRAALAERDALAALRATQRVDGDLCRRLREQLFGHAPKAVLRSLLGVDAPYAWTLRERALPLTKEALDSVDGMDDPRAWALREAGVELWPATAVSSLLGLAATRRGRAVVARALAAAPENLAVLRNAHAVLAPSAAGAEPRAPAAVEETCSI